jgi:hypothetical protein
MATGDFLFVVVPSRAGVAELRADGHRWRDTQTVDDRRNGSALSEA